MNKFMLFLLFPAVGLCAGPESRFVLRDLYTRDVHVFSGCTQFVGYQYDVLSGRDRLVISSEGCAGYSLIQNSPLPAARGARLGVEFSVDVVNGVSFSGGEFCNLRHIGFADEIITTGDSQLLVDVQCKFLGQNPKPFGPQLFAE